MNKELLIQDCEHLIFIKVPHYKCNINYEVFTNDITKCNLCDIQNNIDNEIILQPCGHSITIPQLQEILNFMNKNSL